MPNTIFDSSVPTKAVAVVPSDTAGVNFSRLYVGVAGVVRIVDLEGNTTDWSCPAGFYLEQACSKVMFTGTTASAIVGQS